MNVIVDTAIWSKGSNTDFLISAAAHRHSYSIFTTDRDFHNFQAHILINILGVE